MKFQSKAKTEIDSSKPQCPSCNLMANWVWRRETNKGGHKGVRYCCAACGYRSPVLEKMALVFDYLKQYGFDYLSIPENKLEDMPVCSVCGKEGAELHHWAPQHIFEDAEEWPKDYLCQEHHAQWHSMIKRHK